MRKIVEQGSLYGVPSTQMSDSLLDEHDQTEIQKPVNFLREGELEMLYEQFKDEIEKLKEEEDSEANKRHLTIKTEEQTSASKSKGSVQSTAWMKIGQKTEQPMKITNVDDSKTLVSRSKSVPRTSKGPLPNQLTEDEKKQLRERVKKFTDDLKAKVDATYPDDYMASTLID